MASYIARRIIRAAVTLIIFQTILFVLVHSVPWDSVNLVRMPAGYQRAFRQVLGLDLPLWQQYVFWLRDFISGDLGRSFQLGGAPVMSLFLARIPRTLLLFLPGTLMGFGLGLWLGKHIAWRRGGGLEWGATLGGVVFYTSFAPWLAFVLTTVFAISLGWMPPENILDASVWAGTKIQSGTVIWWILLTIGINALFAQLIWQMTRRLAWRRFGRLVGVLLLSGLTGLLWNSSGLTPFALDILHHLALPLVALILLTFGETMLLMRAAMIDVLKENHVTAARAKGLKEHLVRDRHVARLALLPILTRFIVQLPLVIIGGFVLERVFFWQGMGEMLFQAIESYDVPVIMGILSMVGILMLIAHMALDILAAWLDPRLRVGSLLVD